MVSTRKGEIGLVSQSDLDDSPIQTYQGELKLPVNDQLKWYGPDNPQNYIDFCKAAEGLRIPEKYRLDDDWEYSFNKSSFRGEEYDPNARRRIAVCGCSYTFGLGIKWEQTFAYHFKQRFAEHHGFDLNEVNLLNFAQGAVSNDYIARMLLTQLSTEFRPDLALVYFTHQERKEYVGHDRIEGVGVWRMEPENPHEPSLDYYTYYTDEMGFINTLRNMILVQSLLKLRKIPYVFAWVGSGNLAEERYMKHPVCRQYIDQLDRTHFATFTLLHDDVARDNEHPGPQSNEIFGNRLFDFYTQFTEQSVQEGQ